MRTTRAEGRVEILKSDARGRVRMPKDKQEALLEEFEKSGMSGMAFAQWAGIKYPTFASWAQKRRKARGLSGKSTTLEWVEAQLPQAAAGAAGHGLLIQLPGGARMEVAGIGQVALAVEVIRRLEAQC